MNTYTLPYPTAAEKDTLLRCAHLYKSLEILHNLPDPTRITQTALDMIAEECENRLPLLGGEYADAVNALLWQHTTAYCWEQDGFRVEIGPPSLDRDEYGKPHYCTRLYDGGRLIFDWCDLYSLNPMGPKLLDDALFFFTLTPDTGVSDEYYDRYTPAQIAWRDGPRCEALALILSDFD